MQDATSRQNEPRVTLFASDPARLRGFGDDPQPAATAVSLADLRPGRGLPERRGRGQARTRRRATRCGSSPGSRAATVRVRAVVALRRRRHRRRRRADAARSAPSGCSASRGSSRRVFVSNSGRRRSRREQVIRLLTPTVAPLGLEADNTKQDALEAGRRSRAPRSCRSSRPSARSRSPPASC